MVQSEMPIPPPAKRNPKKKKKGVLRVLTTK
jgi:hypothetical protein